MAFPEFLTDGFASRRPTRVVLVDDHAMVRRGLGDLVGEWAEFDVTGEAGCLADALALVEAQSPDVVVLDLRLPDDAELAAVGLVTARAPATRVLVFSAHEERFHAMQALADGARGYLMKGAPPSEIRRALRTVAAGGRFLSARLAEQLRAGYDGRFRESGDHPTSTTPVLTSRQRQVLDLIGQGFTVADVADRLGLSTKTVETHCANMKGRLGLQSARDLLCYAVATTLG